MIKLFLTLCFAFPIVLGIPRTEHTSDLNIHFDNFYKALTPKELVEAVGYNGEVHYVTTEDGYILEIERITGPKGSSKSGKKPAVLLLHGLFDSSVTWILTHPTHSLAFLLSDRGYDVWLGNVRGNRYSRKHVRMSTTDSNFWKFSWHEMGIYDLPAMIDYILEETKQEKIFYVGHSQGGTSFFVMASERPEYQKKLIAAFNLAPAVFMEHTRNFFIRLLTPIANNLKALGDLLGIYEFQPSEKLIQILGKEMCKENANFQPLCRAIIFLAAGIDKELNMTVAPIVAQYDPAGASTMQIVHYAQLINSGKFQQFDYGLIDNLRIHRHFRPPEYNLANVNMPVYIYYSLNDALVDYKDTLRLHKVLPNSQKFLVSNKFYAHLDFVWGNNVDTLVYSNIFSLMDKYKN